MFACWTLVMRNERLLSQEGSKYPLKVSRVEGSGSLFRKEKLPPASLYSRYLGQGTLSQNGMHCRGTCVMCLRAQSLPFAYLCRSCQVGYVCVRVDSALHSCLPPACSFPSQTPLRGRREETQGLGTNYLSVRAQKTFWSFDVWSSYLFLGLGA